MADPRINIRVGTSGVSTTQRTLQGLMMNVRSWALGVGGALAAAFGTREIVRNLKAATDSIDKIGADAQRVGITAEALSGLGYAAEQSKTGTEALQKSLEKLGRAIGEADILATYARAFEAAGVATRDAAGQLRGIDEVFLDLADRFAEMPDGAQKTTIAMELLGKSGAEMIPMLNQGSDAIRGLMEEARRIGIVVSAQTAKAAGDLNDRLNRLRRTGTGLWWQLAGQILPAVNRLAESLVVLTDASGPMRELWLGIGSLIGSAVDELAAFGAGMANVTASAKAFLTTLKDTKSFSQAAWAAQTAGMAVQMTTLWRGSTTSTSRVGSAGTDTGPVSAAADEIAEAKAKYWESVSKILTSEAGIAGAQQEQLKQLRELTRLRYEAVTVARDASINADHQLVQTKEYLAAQQAYVQARQQELDLARQLDEQERSRQSQQYLGTFGGQLGLQSAAMFQQLGTAAANAANIVTSTLGTAFDSISEQIQGLIRGTVSWAQALANIGTSVLTNLLASIVNFFVSMAARALLSALFGAAITKAAAAAASAAWAGPAILANTATYGAAGAVGVGATMASLSGAPLVTAAAIGGGAAGFADGGLIPAGERLIRVNEQGPEFVVNAQATRRYLPELEAINSGGGSSGGGKVAVFIVDDTRDIRKRLEADPSFSDVIVRTIRNRRTDVGIS